MEKDEISELIKEKTSLLLGINKMNELSRLVYEINRREGDSFEKILSAPDISTITENAKLGFLDKFAALKKALVLRRYPGAAKEKEFAVYFSRLKSPQPESRTYGGNFYPDKIYIEKAAEKYPLAGKIKEVFGHLQCETIESLKEHRKNNPADGLDPKKRDLFVCVEKWDFVKPCPCTKNVVNCGYNIINLGFGCPFDCSYCYLQQYSNFSGIVMPANINDYFPALDEYLENRKGTKIRIGTGEFTDSLALDHITGYARELAAFFKGRNAQLELKTKSANIGNLEGADHGENTVISWSLNPEKIVEDEESGAASLEERLAAAKSCYSWGYGVGFHFDPVIHYPGWERGYEDTINAMFDAVPHPAWISIGTLRFQRTLKDVIEARFPGCGYIYGELTLGTDKKMRYYPTLRKEIFTKMSQWIMRRSETVEVYLCMETPDMWHQVLGKTSPIWNLKRDQ